ncbi:hypothetical protein PHET_06044 [Paragonimus heterotremus]|uniref:Transmembrane protein n=1 Tax=Paragonimus heterotremus TaxID=100268 RepID=A0A8J4SWJ7_9TREM|nr:hypothetical protein PHET_06044 [Paragonimus heterotremus]
MSSKNSVSSMVNLKRLWFQAESLHSPFNPLLASIVPSFDFGVSQRSEHCGLVSKLSEPHSNVTLYVYSNYENPLIAWVRVDAFSSEYPMPGGCGHYASDSFASAVISHEVMLLPWNLRSKGESYETLRYWTTVIKFDASALPQLTTIKEACDDVHTVPSNVLRYHLYSTPLVTAGGDYGSFVNPTVQQVAAVIRPMTPNDTHLGTLVRTFTIDDKNEVEIPITRRPGTASVLRLVAEYRNAKLPIRVAYAPMVLYGCPQKQPHANRLSTAFVVQNHSYQLSCGILPPNSPNIYFPVAVVLLVSLFYGCSGSLLIWPRCAVSVMMITSLFGTVLFYRYSSPTADDMFLLAISVLIPAFVALAVFIIVWCVCIRPTLHYQQLFGRGPLMKVSEVNGTTAPIATAEPWNTEPLLLSGSATNSQASNTNLLFQSNDRGLNGYNPLSPVTEEQPSHNLIELCTPSVPEYTEVGSIADASNEATMRSVSPWWCHSYGQQIMSRLRCSWCTSLGFGRSTRILSLKPRRLARLPPVFPASFLFISCLSVLMDRTLSLTVSAASYLTFVLLMSCLVLCPLCIFKNLAFGLSTALVGVYLTMSSICLFLIPNALLPHLLIEQFLRLTWIEIRLDTLRIESLGLYDVLMFAVWALGTVIFGLLTLCLVRLQDARELVEAQHGRPAAHFPRHRTPSSTVLSGPNHSTWNDTVVLPRGSFYLSNKPTPPIAGHTSWEYASSISHTPLTSSIVHGSCETLDNLTDSGPTNFQVHTERSQLVTSAIATTSRSPDCANTLLSKTSRVVSVAISLQSCATELLTEPLNSIQQAVTKTIFKLMNEVIGPIFAGCYPSTMDIISQLINTPLKWLSYIWKER